MVERLLVRGHSVCRLAQPEVARCPLSVDVGRIAVTAKSIVYRLVSLDESLGGVERAEGRQFASDEGMAMCCLQIGGSTDSFRHITAHPQGRRRQADCPLLPPEPDGLLCLAHQNEGLPHGITGLLRPFHRPVRPPESLLGAAEILV
ncbi:hypothetical protein AB0D24_03030 [Streptomyces javensis]|uniref:hypothetical protein n=1 Tax=Streptomyces javensis TaxID=114698 RepID=UPI0033FF0F91